MALCNRKSDKNPSKNNAKNNRKQDAILDGSWKQFGVDLGPAQVGAKLGTSWGMIRKLLCGDACKKTDKQGNPLEHMQSLSNHDCCVRARVPTPIVLLKTMRLQFLQNLVRFPEFHEICLSTLFGRYIFEDDYTSNPWIEQWYHDLCACHEFDGMIDIIEHLQNNP